MSCKITIVGVGMVGSAFAYRLVTSGLNFEVVLIDVNKDRAEGEAMDLNHASSVDGLTKVRAGDYKDAKDSDFVVVTAGIPQKPGQTRLDLVDTNAKLMKNITSEIKKYTSNSFLIIASNPLDVMTYAALKYSGFDYKKVIGSGTVLDSNRLKFHLSQKLNCKVKDIIAYTLGEHGDSQIPIFSKVSVKGMSLLDYCEQMGISFDKKDKADLIRKTVKAAYPMIEKKGYTNYGIASSLFRIIKSIYYNERTILPISSLLHGEYGFSDVCLSVPAMLGENGVEKVLTLDLNQVEYNMLKKSQEKISDYIKSV
jgi:L-lactate dehydrogenase